MKRRTTRIHVNQHVIRRNAKTGERSPVLTVKSGSENTYCHEVRIDGPSRGAFSPDMPLSCGANFWIETVSPVTVGGVHSVTPTPPEKRATREQKCRQVRIKDVGGRSCSPG